MVGSYMAVFNLAEDEDRIRSLTAKRSIAALPFASRFRVIDFMLSNIVNGGITNVGIFSEKNTRSLVDHIGDGKPWDLNRKNDGIFLFNHGLLEISDYDSRISLNNMDYFSRSKSQNVILTSSYMVCNMDIADIIEKHEASGADITCVYTHTNNADKEFIGCYTLEVDEKTGEVKGRGKNNGYSADADISMEVFLMKKSTLIELTQENSRNRKYASLYDLIFSKLGKLKFNTIRFDGYVACINSNSSYFKANMEMLDMNVSNELFRSKRPVYTKIKDEPPTIYVKGSEASNSFIADGNIIKGSVKNSIIGRFVVVEEGACVEDSIVLQNVKIGAGAKLKGAIVDKNAVIEAGAVFQGDNKSPAVVEP